jgi:hypothetical protein
MRIQQDIKSIAPSAIESEPEQKGNKKYPKKLQINSPARP